MRAGGVLASAFAAFALVMGPTMDQPVGSGEPGQWRATVCSGHGQTDSGRCVCNAGWSGTECSSADKPLECGDHGKALHGWCVCDAGWKGHACQTGPVSCSHGQVANGKCVCEAGWSGEACNKGP